MSKTVTIEVLVDDDMEVTEADLVAASIAASNALATGVQGEDVRRELQQWADRWSVNIPATGAG